MKVLGNGEKMLKIHFHEDLKWFLFDMCCVSVKLLPGAKIVTRISISRNRMNIDISGCFHAMQVLM